MGLETMNLYTSSGKTKQRRGIAALIFLGLGAMGVGTAAGQVQLQRRGVNASRGISQGAALPSSSSPVQAFVSSAGTATTLQVSGTGITFTCDPSIALGPAGLCASLGTVISPLYTNTFTNAKASVYITFDPAAGLADTTQFFNTVTYATFYNALQSVSTGPAKAFVPSTEPAIFGGKRINVPSALARVLGITTADQGGGDGPVAGITFDSQLCTTPGTGTCYDNYDFYSVVEHELDEILGTASCIGFPSEGTLSNQGNCASAMDQFRYTATGTRAFDTIGSIDYFSPDGGLTNTQGNLYNTTSPGGDWGDFSQSCKFVQDAGACPSGLLAANSFDITTEGPGGTFGPEVFMLNAIGYNLKPIATPSFTITPIPPAEIAFRGVAAGFILQLKSVNGFNGNVTLSCSGGPAGSKCADFPMTVKVNGTAYAVSGILFPKTTPPGVYTLNFKGVSGSLTSTATAKFTVK